MTGVRHEIQALRALAVLAVLTFHLWPLRLPGGFVGVDIFFVVSGYLITAHLLREHERTGSISLPRFWSRRARRLLPASLLVLAVTAGGVYLLASHGRWPQFGQEIISSALYVENWNLAAQAVDYMALSNVKSPTQHFWTLSVEEQFYLFWPLLILGFAAVGRRMKWSATTIIIVGIAGVGIASLIHSILFTSSSASLAYFFTTTRVWEFAFGALLAVVLPRIAARGPIRGAGALSWTGLAMLMAAVLLYGPSTPFPSGTALLPVMGTCLVIAAGEPESRWAPTRIFRLKPVQFVGDVSYGVYLWHWPLIVLLPFLLGSDLGTIAKVGIAAASIGLGWLSKRFIEDPIRSGGGNRRRTPAFIWSGVAIAMAVVVVIALPAAIWRPIPVPAPSASVPKCFGATAMTDGTCDSPAAIPLVADFDSFNSDVPPQDILGCEVSAQASAPRRCDFGAPSSPRVALVGDSHATRWTEAVRDVLAKDGWGLSTILISGCPAFVDSDVSTAWGYPETAANCRRLSHDALAQIAADPSIKAVVLTNRTRLYLSSGSDGHQGLLAADVATSIRGLQQAGKKVILLKDPPEMNAVPQKGGASAADCQSRPNGATACSLPRASAVFADPLEQAAQVTGAPVIDLDDLFCDQSLCRSRIGGLIVYSDDNHPTRSFAASTRPAWKARLTPLLPPG